MSVLTIFLTLKMSVLTLKMSVLSKFIPHKCRKNGGRFLRKQDINKNLY